MVTKNKLFPNFRNRRKASTEHIFTFGHHVLTVVPQYLGVYFEEFLSFFAAANILAESAGWSVSFRKKMKF